MPCALSASLLEIKNSVNADSRPQDTYNSVSSFGSTWACMFDGDIQETFAECVRASSCARATLRRSSLSHIICT